MHTRSYKTNIQNLLIMKFYKTVFIAILTFVSFSCGTNDDQEDQVSINSPSNLNFPESTIAINFYTEGFVTPTSLDWGGETGNFELGSPIQGVSINSNTGSISWDRSLPLGNNNISVIARNSAGFVSATIQIENNFQGFFEGGYNTDANSNDYSTGYTMTFNSDNTMFGDDNGSNFSGNYTIINNTVTVSYTYDTGGDFSTSGTISYDNTTNPVYQGTWGETPSTTNGGGLRLGMN